MAASFAPAHSVAHFNSVDRRTGGDRRKPARASLPNDRRTAGSTRVVFFETLRAVGIAQKSAAIDLGIDPATLSRMATGDPTHRDTPKLTSEMLDRAMATLGPRFCDEFRRRLVAAHGFEPALSARDIATALRSMASAFDLKAA